MCPLSPLTETQVPLSLAPLLLQDKLFPSKYPAGCAAPLCAYEHTLHLREAALWLVPQAACASPLQTQACIHHWWNRQKLYFGWDQVRGLLTNHNLELWSWEMHQWCLSTAAHSGAEGTVEIYPKCKVSTLFSCPNSCLTSSLSNRLVAQDRQLCAWCSVQQALPAEPGWVSCDVQALLSLCLQSASLRLCSPSHIRCGLPVCHCAGHATIGGHIKLGFSRAVVCEDR